MTQHRWTTDSRLSKALARYLDGEPEPEDGPELARAMQADAGFAEEVRSLLVVDDLLRQNSEPDADAFVDGLSIRTRGGAGDELVRRVERKITPPRRVRAAGWLPWLVAATATAAAIAAVLVDLPGKNRSRGDAPASTADAGPVRPEAEDVVALLVDEVEAEFAAGAAPAAVRFAPGVYELKNGVVHLRFASGADVVIPAPARFLLRDPLRMALEEGSLRALVPPTAQGFTVDAPGVAYEDLGTEFGVAVARGKALSEVHVFAGAVDVKSPAGRKLSSLSLGESASVAGGLLGPAAPPNLALYPTPADIGLLRWKRSRDALRKDPSLVCYFPFEERPGEPQVLADATGSIDGRITGARWVSGRWPGKQALLFDRQGDAVEVALPDAYTQFTVAAWVRVERLDFELNALFDSDGWETGDFHLQLNRTGHLQGGLCGNSHIWFPETSVPVGRWAHVAAVIDLDRATSAVYWDGVLADESPIPKPELGLRPGACRIGDWLRRPDWTHVPERGFRGRIDELAIWNRALTESELREQFEAGRPSLLAVVAERPPEAN